MFIKFFSYICIKTNITMGRPRKVKRIYDIPKLVNGDKEGSRIIIRECTGVGRLEKRITISGKSAYVINRGGMKIEYRDESAMIRVPFYGTNGKTFYIDMIMTMDAMHELQSVQGKTNGLGTDNLEVFPTTMSSYINAINSKGEISTDLWQS